MSGKTRWAVRRVGRAFTLIEILISILVLGLGLLGIGAVFPVIVREQKISQDQTRGSIQARVGAAEIKAMLLGREFNEGGKSIWDAWLDQRHDDGGSEWYRGTWNEDQWDNDYLETDFTPELSLPPEASDNNSYERLRLPFSQRRDGGPTAGAGTYVWDAAVQPVPYRFGDQDFGNDANREPDRDRVRFVVFVRRMFRDRDGDAILPQVTGGDGTGYPVREDGNSYARPRTAAVEVRLNTSEFPPPENRSVLYVPDSVGDDVWTSMRQAGQRLVDNLGNTYTVKKWSSDERPERFVIIEPPIPSSINRQSEEFLDSVVLTPQVPAGVLVFEVKP